MSETLNTIQKMIQEVKIKLDQCSPKSFKQSDVDKAAQERMLLKEKLNMLESAELAEKDVIAAAEAEDRQIRKEEFLQSVAKESANQQKTFNSLTTKLNKTLLELVMLHEERSQLFYPSSFGLNKPENKRILSQEEIGMLGKALSSLRYNHIGNGFERSFSMAFRHAIDQLPSDSGIRTKLNKLVNSTWGGKEPYQPMKQSIPDVCEAILNPTEIPDELDAEY